MRVTSPIATMTAQDYTDWCAVQNLLNDRADEPDDIARLLVWMHYQRFMEMVREAKRCPHCGMWMLDVCESAQCAPCPTCGRVGPCHCDGV